MQKPILYVKLSMLNLSLKAGQKERFTFAVGKCVTVFSMAAARLDPSLPVFLL